MKNLLTYFIAATLIVQTAKADEGMWLLPLIEKLNVKDMKKAGFKLSAENIYNLNSSSIKDAIVIFGGGCTGEIISNQGLLLTNHHCGYGAIQQHSSVEHNYLKDGFWAKNKAEEIHTPGLNVSFLERIEDVTDKIIPLVKDIESEKERLEQIGKLTDSIAKNAKNNVSYLRAQVATMFGGNEYYLIVYKVFTDVRMVGAPPSSIGKFGADTDNWMWPRQTGDFSLFRVYGDANGNPAEYSAENVPLKPKYHLPVSLKGFSEGDFAMVMGFPGSTQRYMTAAEVEERMTISNANRIKIRGIRQELMMEDMLADPKIKIQYASKYSTSSNYWKNSIGMNKALKKLGVIEQKQAQEVQFKTWTVKNKLYGNALDLIESAIKERKETLNASQYISESLLQGSEIVRFAMNFVGFCDFLKSDRRKPENEKQSVETLKKTVETFFKDYSPTTDKKISAAMYKLYFEDVEKQYRVEMFETINEKYSGDFRKYAEDLFAGTFLTDRAKVEAFLENYSVETLENDPAVQLARSVREKQTSLQRINESGTYNFREGHRKYVAGLMEMYKGIRPIYPDANFTMRMTYGNIAGYDPSDAAHYSFITTEKGILEKEDPGNWEFEVPEKLKELIKAKDFGAYAMSNGHLPVCFIFDGDITGGNSGSPVLNNKGELIGTAFDGNWEAMSGDIAFEKNLQRCINVDIRYVLFIIDKFAGAKYLIDEMTIVK